MTKRRQQVRREKGDSLLDPVKKQEGGREGIGLNKAGRCVVSQNMLSKKLR